MVASEQYRFCIDIEALQGSVHLVALIDRGAVIFKTVDEEGRRFDILCIFQR